MRHIRLTKGYAAVVDDEDYARVSANRWHAMVDSKRTDGTVRVYARRTLPVNRPGAKEERMHRFVIGASDGVHVDHINGDTLDNRKENLRVCQKSENNCNRCIQHGGTSVFKGVCWHKGEMRWRAKIQHLGVSHHLGYYNSETDAALAYNKAATTMHGEYARLNNV